jgi:hypothetical protein
MSVYLSHPPPPPPEMEFSHKLAFAGYLFILADFLRPSLYNRPNPGFLSLRAEEEGRGFVYLLSFNICL